jgi:hypothetical protein
VVPVVYSQVGERWIHGVTSPEMIMAPGLSASGKGVEPVPSAGAPGSVARYLKPTYWLPANASAEQITGKIGFSADRVVLAGQAYAITLQRPLKPEELSEAATVFNSAPPPSADAFWFRVAIPPSARMRGGVGMCGDASAGWMLAMVFDEQRDVLQLAFYASAGTPDLAPPPLTETKRLCQTLRYVPNTDGQSGEDGEAGPG